MKVCCRCKIELPLDSFQNNRAAPDGLQYRCKDCTKKASKACRAARGHLWLSTTSPWKKRNRVRANETEKRRRAKQPEKMKLENRSWRERNPFSMSVSVANRRSKELGIGGIVTQDEWKEVATEANFICHICGIKTTLEIGNIHRISLDHVIPLTRGGGNTKGNLAPACKLCNQSRHNMLLSEFDSWLNRVLKFRGKQDG